MTAVADTPAQEPTPRRLRLLPAPDCEPPAVPHSVAAAALRARSTPRRPEHGVQGVLALAAPQPLAEEDGADFGPQPTPTSALPPAVMWCHRLAQAVAEILTGQRPVTQLLRWATQEVYDELADRSALASRTPPLGQRRTAVRGLRVCEPVDGVAEASAVVFGSGRPRAMALRVEGLDGRWRLTALEIG